MDKSNIEILIADDSSTQLEFLRHHLEKEGYFVVAARNGKDALEAISRNKPDLIVSDIVMPVMSGYDLCSAVKNDKLLRDIPVILLTTLSDTADIVRGLECMVDYYITKPYDTKHLLSQIELILSTPLSNRYSANLMDISFQSENASRSLKADPQRLVNLLFSTYENAVHINRNLMKLELKRREINEELDLKIKELNDYQRELDLHNVELKKIQFELVESQKKYKDLFDFAPVGYCIFDKDMIVTSINMSATDKLHLKKSEIINTDFTNYIWEQDKAEFLSILKKIKESMSKQYCEIRLVKSNGEKFFARLEILHVKNNGKEEDYFRTVITDITEQKLFEEYLRDSEERFRLIAETIPDIIIKIDTKGMVEYVSPKIKELLNYEPEKILGTPIAEYIVPGDRPEILKHIKNIKNEKSLRTLEICLLHENGDSIVIEWKAAPIFKAGEFLGFICTARDIRERKKTEDIIKRESGINDALAELSKSILSINTIEEISFKVFEIMKSFSDSTTGYVGIIDQDTGLVRSTVLGGDVWKNCYLYKDNCIVLEEGCKGFCNWTFNEARPLLFNKFQEESKVINIETCAVSVNKLLSVPAKIEDVVVGMIQVCDANREYNENDLKLLERLADIFAIAINRKNTEHKMLSAMKTAEEATNAKSEFLANMSHEIRTPMNAIIGMNHLLGKTDLNGKQKDYINKVHMASESLLGLINDILDFSKIEAGKLDIEAIPFDLSDVLTNLANMIGMKASEKGLELLFNVEDNVPYLLIGDSLRLTQVLLNLTNNAVKFTDIGEIIVSIECLKKDESWIQLKFSVKDSGIGLSSEQMKKLFKSFSQADATTTRKYGGTGLGLSISKALAELMGGNISVESEPGIGSVFNLTALFQLQTEQQPKYLQPLDDLKGMDVLLGEDNVTSRVYLKRILEGFSFKVTDVSTGKELLEKLENSADDNFFKLIVLDWLMPELDGIETVKKIRKSSKIKIAPKILMISAHNKDELIKKAEGLGIDGFVTKPVSRSTLFNAIIELFGIGNSERRNAIEEEAAPKGLEKIYAANILLVEDNEINQQVAREILEGEGFRVSIASDGKEALAMLDSSLEKEKFNLVLMDLQMPVMDGFEAVSKIRENDEFSALPIIAMTADAMSEVKNKVIEAGMNDYLAKPIKPEELFLTLLKWIKPGDPKQYAAKCNDKNANGEIIFPEFININVNEGLARVNHNRQFYKKMLLKFSQSNENIVEEIRDALDRGDRKTAERLAHTLQGVAGNIGIHGIRKYAIALERSLKQKNYNSEEIDNRIMELYKELSKVVEEINEYSNISSGNAKIANTGNKFVCPEEMQSLMGQFKKSLKANSADSCDFFEEIKSKLEGLDFDDDLNNLSTLMNEFDFDNAFRVAEDVDEKLKKFKEIFKHNE